jgi:hypothetical protein
MERVEDEAFSPADRIGQLHHAQPRHRRLARQARTGILPAGTGTAALLGDR